MSLHVIIDDVETEVFPAIDPDGLPIIEDGLPIYVTADGVPVRVNIIQEAGPQEAGPQEAGPPGPSTQRAEELWPAERVLLLIELVENKWRLLEKRYRQAKRHNSISGNDRRTCEFEKQLAEVFEVQHTFNPVYLAGPGRERIRRSDQSAAASPQPPAAASPLPRTSRGSVSDDTMESRPASPSPLPAQQGTEPTQQEQEEEQQQQQPPQGRRARRGPRRDPNRVLVEGFLNYLKNAEENRERRHKEHMEAKERRHQENLAVAKQLASSLEQQQHQHFPDMPSL
ncbi:hypothetical protein HPB50_006918 [Hyalomma asiaticum]|uniref:Uncharacterized protein n=1 Tax=Hyalomma asiaticum TaxID=266040 RepID=A0ACB7TD10_HYAAI|nr:hypothetical protein HPB50_006918 [Hyalomma asiaticum]